MGDCLLLTSPIRALKEEFPDFRITVLVESRFAGCFEGNPDIDEVISIARKKQALRARQAPLRSRGEPPRRPDEPDCMRLLARGPHVGFEQFQYRRLYRGLLPPPIPRCTASKRRWPRSNGSASNVRTPPPLRFESSLAGSAEARIPCEVPTL